MIGSYWLIGAVWAVFCGWALSSYASSLIHRLPRGEYVFGRKPYCGACSTPLQPRDLFPILSYYRSDGKCRYCGAQVPLMYYVLEVIYPLIFLCTYSLWGFSEKFLLVSLALAAVVIMVMLAVTKRYFSAMLTVFLATIGLVMRALQQGTILDALLGAVLMLLLAGVVTGYLRRNAEPDLRQFPPVIWLAMLLGVWFPLLYAAPAVLLLAAGFRLRS